MLHPGILQTRYCMSNHQATPLVVFHLLVIHVCTCVRVCLVVICAWHCLQVRMVEDEMAFLDATIRLIPCGKYIILDFDWVADSPQVMSDD